MPKMAIKTQYIEIDKERRLVVMSEEEYDNLLDTIDNLLAEQIERNENDPVLSLEEAEKKLFGRKKKSKKKRSQKR